MSSISKTYTDDKTTLYDLKKTNTKVDKLLDYFYLLLYNKKGGNDAIIENARICENIKNNIKII